MTIPTIQKVTVSYDEQEDRLQLAVEDQDANVIALWLTQRLANRLISALLARLAEATASQPDASTRAILHAWEQSAAYAQHSPQAPVQSLGPVTRSLVTSVDISHAGGQFCLVFRWPDNNAAALPLDSTAVRQWLGIVYGRYRQAEWNPEGIWPSWIEPQDVASTTVARSLH